LAVMLLVGAGLLLRSFNELQRVDPGFEPEGVITAGLSLPGARYAGAEEVNRFQSDLLARVRSIPQVQEAGLANALPWTGFDENAGFEIDGWTAPPDLVVSLRYHFVSPGYLESIGVPIESGRPLYESDDSEATPVVLINASMARQYWTDHPDAGEPLGAVIHFWGNEWTVVGIVGDVKDGPREAEAEPAAFAPLQQISRRNVSLTVRVAGDPRNIVAPLRQTLAEVDPAIPLTNIRTLDEITAGNTAEARFMALLVGLFAAVALLLAVVGLYGLMTYMVGQRTREIAVRMALGAEAPQVVKSVVLEGVSLAGIGLAVGLVASLGLTRLLTALLFGVSPFDPLTLLVAGAGLLLVAGASCFLPARKAAGVQPMEAMR
jgi:predicted permease